MPTYAEMKALIDGMNSAGMASGKGKLYDVLQCVPEKTEAHKAKWRRFNEARVELSRNWRGKKHGCKWPRLRSFRFSQNPCCRCGSPTHHDAFKTLCLPDIMFCATVDTDGT